MDLAGPDVQVETVEGVGAAVGLVQAFGMDDGVVHADSSDEGGGVPMSPSAAVSGVGNIAA